MIYNAPDLTEDEADQLRQILAGEYPANSWTEILAPTNQARRAPQKPAKLVKEQPLFKGHAS